MVRRKLTPTHTVGDGLDPPPQIPTSIHPTVFYKASGIVVCEKCGDKRRTNNYGQAICPLEDPECPMVNGDFSPF